MVGLAVISEVVADVLQEAMENGEDGLPLAEVVERIYPDRTNYWTIRDALLQMQRQGETENKGTASRHSWRLTT